MALVGADGAGKTTVGHALVERGHLPLSYVYMGSNPEASTHSLPTTRLWRLVRKRSNSKSSQGGPPDPARAQRKRAASRGLLRPIRNLFRLCFQLTEEWYRQWVAWRLGRKGRIVLFDRHFFADHFAHEIAGSARGTLPLSRRLHGLILRRLYPRPDLVIVLDAPAQVLFERKHEGTVELLEARRQEYFALKGEVAHFEVVDATRSKEQVVDEVERLIRARSGSP